MNSLEIIEYLKSEASEKYKNDIVRMGIPAEYCIGVSTAILRNFAKKLKKSSFLPPNGKLKKPLFGGNYNKFSPPRMSEYAVIIAPVFVL